LFTTLNSDDYTGLPGVASILTYKTIKELARHFPTFEKELLSEVLEAAEIKTIRKDILLRFIALPIATSLSRLFLAEARRRPVHVLQNVSDKPLIRKSL
jgi:hypothetical protein